MSQPSTSETIAHRLREQILTGAYKPGERLPAERDLATRLGVNRSSVREALKKLEQLGLVAIRRGDGTTVRHLHEASIEIVRHLLLAGGKVNRPLLEQLLDAQEMLLAGATYLAVERSAERDIARARVVLSQLRAAETPAEFHRMADELVDLVAEASGNLVLRLFRNSVRPVLMDGQRLLETHLETDRVALDRALTAIDASLVARDPAGAEKGTRALYRLRRESLMGALDAAGF